MISAAYKATETSASFGSDFRDRVEAIRFARTQYSCKLTTGDGVMMSEEMTFSKGVLVRMRVNIDGKMVDMMEVQF